MRKVLIGTPIHKMKDYSIERWISSVSKIDYPTEYWKLLMVDNSEDEEWHKKIYPICEKLAFYNFELRHIAGMRDGEDFEALRLSKSREEIRQEMLWKGYDYWFSWECDLLFPPDILSYLLTLKDFDAVYHTYPPRGNPVRGWNEYYKEQDGIGCVLYKRNIFHNLDFMNNGEPRGTDGRLIFEILRRGYKIAELHNIFRLEHLAE